MKDSTCLRIFRNWKRGKDTVLRNYKYSILFAPLMNTWYFIRADKNGEDWDWYKACPYHIQMLIDQYYKETEEKHDKEGYTEMFEDEVKKKTMLFKDEFTGKKFNVDPDDIHTAQLELDLNLDDSDEEEIADVSVDQLMKMLDDGWVVNQDDIYDEIVDSLGKVHDTFLNGIYYVTKADNVEDVKRADVITKEEVHRLGDKLDILLTLYFKSCFNEYQIERDDAFAALTPEKLN